MPWDQHEGQRHCRDPGDQGRFREDAHRIPVSSTKSMIGHTIGAAGAIEAVASCLAIEEQILPPTINYEHLDPECDLDYVPNAPRRAKVHTVVSNSFGFAV